MLYYFKNRKGLSIGLIAGVVLLAIVMAVLFESIKAAVVVLCIPVLIVGVAWLWRAEDE